MNPATLEVIALPGMPLVRQGDDLALLVDAALRTSGLDLRDGDVVVFAQKIVSKSEGRSIDLAGVTPSERAIDVGLRVRKDPRLVELVLRESRRIVREAPDVLIVEHRLGYIMANAGIDQSNVADAVEGDRALLLPLDPDASAEHLRAALTERRRRQIAVVINDSFGRPWRLGTVGIALGCAGLPALLDLRGTPDLFGRTLRVTVVAYADEIAAAASLLMGQGSEGRPVIIVRGLERRGAAQPAAAIVRPAREDLFK
jgi:coenzyme F420-0:L-glutamate ligase / coenzyme F420-1:gamma-L-glutamate ligase